MVDLNKLIPTARLVVYSIVCVLSLINFCIACHLISETTRYYYSFYWTFTALGLATALLSLLSLPVMYWLSVSRKGVFTSYVVTEVVWCWFLWIMWIATAGSTTWVNGASGGIASEAQAFEAFAFINWFALLFYTNLLFVVAIIAQTKGHPSVWTSDVKDFDFNTAVNQSAIPAVTPQLSGQPAMAQQQYYPPQQTMQQPQQPLAPQAGYAPQAAYTPQHTGSGFAGHPQGTPQQAPVAMV
jgi:hypothetical protein